MENVFSDRLQPRARSLSVILQPPLRRVTAFVTVPRSVTAFVTVAGEASDGKELAGVRIQRNRK